MSQLTGKDRGQEEKREPEDEVFGWHGITDSMNMSLKKTPGDSEGQGSLVCCSPWGQKESDRT